MGNVNTSYTRRQVLKGVGALGLLGFGGSALAACNPGASNGEAAGNGQANGAVALVGTTWGDPWLTAAQEASQEWTDREPHSISWHPAEGPTATVLARIAASWPDPDVDLVASWDAYYGAMDAEGWLAAVTPELVPNINQVPDRFLPRNAAGDVLAVPMSVTGACWGFRDDAVDIEFQSLDDLLNPALRGRICMPAATMHSGMAIVSIALHAGGDEHNLDPGFEFLQELARSGNIGRVPSTEAEFITSLTSGETAISFWNFGGWNEVDSHFGTTMVNRDTDDPGLRGYLFTEGLTILEGPNAEIALDLANDFLDPSINHDYNSALGQGTTNADAEPVAAVGRYLYDTDEELERYAYIPDYDHLNSELEAINERWEDEIAPLL